jgi:hypothetical protein
MKKALLFSLTLLFIIGCNTDDDGSGSINTYLGDVNLRTQQEVIEFGSKGYTHIEGKICIGCIEQNDINDLRPLRNLKSVETLQIQNFEACKLYVVDDTNLWITSGLALDDYIYSLIIAGTTRGDVKVDKAWHIVKAKQDPALLAQILQNIKKEDLRATIEKVRIKLDSLKLFNKYV